MRASAITPISKCSGKVEHQQQSERQKFLHRGDGILFIPYCSIAKLDALLRLICLIKKSSGCDEAYLRICFMVTVVFTAQILRPYQRLASLPWYQSYLTVNCQGRKATGFLKVLNLCKTIIDFSIPRKFVLTGLFRLMYFESEDCARLPVRHPFISSLL